MSVVAASLIITLSLLLGNLMHRFTRRSYSKQQEYLQFIGRLNRKQQPPPTYQFRLYRRIRNGNDTVITTMDVYRQCYDPFVERIRLGREYPEFAIGTDFRSETDDAYDVIKDDDAELYDALSDDDVDDFFAGYGD